jgi:hypothetical protein
MVAVAPAEETWPADYLQFDQTVSAAGPISFPVKVMGWAIRNPSSTALAEVDFFDGTDASGTVVIPVTLDWNESSRETWCPNGIRFKNGLFINVTAGEVRGSVFWLPLRGRPR